MVTAIASHVFCTYTRIWPIYAKKYFKICVFQTSSFSENDPYRCLNAPLSDFDEIFFYQAVLYVYYEHDIGVQPY